MTIDSSSLRRLLLERLTPALKKIDAAHEAIWIADHAMMESDPLSLAGEIVGRRARGEPLAYIFGSWPFLNFEIEVGPGVLIPRPETEELAEKIVATFRGRAAKSEIKLVDFGAGSGCLGLAIGAQLERAGFCARVTLVENSPLAWPWLKKNMRSFAAASQGPAAELFADDWKAWMGGDVDIIVSNPPYVTESEFSAVEASVKDHEPHSALVPVDVKKFSDASGPYREILGIAQRSLKAGGSVWFELGAAQVEWIKDYAASLDAFREINISRDMAGKPRFFSAQKRE